MTAAVHWLTAESDQQRHASLDTCPASGFRPGVCVLTLCGHQYCTDTSRPTSGCCPTCDDRAHQLQTTR